MSEKTDYKKLWRNARAELVKTSNLLLDKNIQVNSLIDMLHKVKSGELPIKEIFEGEDISEKIRTRADALLSIKQAKQNE